MYELFAPIHGLIQKGLELALDFDVPSLIAVQCVVKCRCGLLAEDGRGNGRPARFGWTGVRLWC